MFVHVELSPLLPHHVDALCRWKCVSPYHTMLVFVHAEVYHVCVCSLSYLLMWSCVTFVNVEVHLVHMEMYHVCSRGGVSCSCGDVSCGDMSGHV